MAGLLQQGAAQAPQPNPQGQPAQPGMPPQQGSPAQSGQPPGQPGQPQPGQGGGGPEPSPEEAVQMREVLVGAMLESLYGPMLEDTRNILAQHPDQPEQGMSRVISQMITVAWKQLQEQGKTVPPGVMVQSAMIAAQAVGEMAIRLGLIPEDDADTIEAAFMLAMGEFGKATAQEMPPEQRQRYGQIIQAIAEGKQAATGGQGGGQPPGGPGQAPPPGAQQGAAPPPQQAQAPVEPQGGM